MPFVKGKPKTGGKKKGTENKASKDIKEAYRMLIENNLDNLTDWLNKVAKNNPERAIYILYNLSEFVIPKLARKEFAGDKENPIELKFTPIQFIDENKPKR